MDSNQSNSTELNSPIQHTPIKDLYVINIKQITDSRGTIRESYRKTVFDSFNFNLYGPWAQINVTETRQGAIRGIHAEDMNKLVGIVSGKGFGVYVDLRKDSSTKGLVFSIILTPGLQVFVPKGVGNGFQSISEEFSQYLYCFDKEWSRDMPGYSITPLDPDLGIEWPIKIDKNNTELISEKDASAPLLSEIIK